MVEPLFDPEECEIAEVPRVDFDFVDLCNILPAPAGIYDCPQIEIPIDPPIPGQICVDLGVSATLTVEDGDPALTVVATRLVNNPGVECVFALDFHMRFPPVPTFDDVCPTVSTSSTVDISQGPPSAEVVVTRITDDGACSLQFDFAFQFPDLSCPTVEATVTSTVASGPPSAELVLTQEGSGGDCQLFFDFGFTLPDVSCPRFNASATTRTITGEAEPAATVVVTRIPVYRRRTKKESYYSTWSVGESTFDSASVYLSTSSWSEEDPTQCSNQLDFEFSLPGCPEITANGTLTVLPGVEAALDIVDTPTEGDCGVNLDFAFTLPCPEVGATTTVSVQDGSPNVTVEVTRPVPDQCGLNFDFDFTLPPIPMERDCPKFSITTTSTSALGLLPSLDGTITRRSAPPSGGKSQCSFDLDLALFSPPLGLSPVTLTTNMSGGVATAQFPNFATFPVYDNGQFKCALAGAKGFAAKNPESGNWQLINSQSKAGRILCTLTNDMVNQESADAEVNYVWGSQQDGQWDFGSELYIDLVDPGDIAKGAKEGDQVLASLNCYDGVYVVEARGGNQRAFLITGVLTEIVVGTEDTVEVDFLTPMSPAPYTAIPEFDEDQLPIQIANPLKHMGQPDFTFKAQWNYFLEQYEIFDVEKVWLRVMTDMTVDDEDNMIIKKHRIIAAETWEEEDTETSLDAADCE